MFRVRSMSKNRSPQLTKAQAFSHIPVKNPEVSESRQGDCALLSYPLPVSPLVSGLASFFSNKTPTTFSKKLELDTMGTHVWDSINGNRTVAQLTTHFAAKFEVTQSEAETSVTAFLRELGQRSLIAMR